MKYILILFLILFLPFQTLAYKEIPIKSPFDWVLSWNDWKTIISHVDVIDIDRETSKEKIDKLHKEWKIVIAYVSVWSYENYRDDKNDFDKSIIWNSYPGWDWEKFLDLSNYEKFSNILESRFDKIKEAWFDGIEPDNMGIFEWDVEWDELTGFNLTKDDGIRFAKYISKLAHDRDLSIGQKNAESITEDVVDYFDWALLEGSFYYDFTSKFEIYIKNNKAVFATEYSDSISKNTFQNKVCIKSKEIWFNTIYKNRDLDLFIMQCDNIDYTKKLSKEDVVINKIIKRIDDLVDKKWISYKNIIGIFERYKSKNTTKKDVKLLIDKVIKKIIEIRLI